MEAPGTASYMLFLFLLSFPPLQAGVMQQPRTNLSVFRLDEIRGTSTQSHSFCTTALAREDTTVESHSSQCRARTVLHPAEIKKLKKKK